VPWSQPVLVLVLVLVRVLEHRKSPAQNERRERRGGEQRSRETAGSGHGRAYHSRKKNLLKGQED
jgi:hypothetical protein